MWAIRHLCAVGALLSAVCGCTSLDLNKTLPFLSREDKPQVPQRITDIWTETVFNQPGQPGVRGFGGRIMFYNEQNKKPIKVDGTLSVYVFDRDADPVQTPPERKYVFPAAELEKHYSQSKIGHSYNFWLPFDETNGPQRDLTLVTRFETEAGEVMLSTPVRQTLIGTPPEKTAKRRSPGAGEGLAQARAVNGAVPNAVRPVSHEAPLQQTPATASDSTLTIDVPPSFAQQGRVLNAPTGSAVAMASATASPLGTEPSLSTGSVPSRFPARRGLAAQSRHAPARRQPLPATWPSSLPATPRSAASGETQDSPGFSPQEPLPTTAEPAR